MTDRTSAIALRWFRSCLLALVAFLSGTVAHVSAGGQLPNAADLAQLFVVLVCVCAAVLGRIESTTRIVALVLAGQTFIHVAMSALAGHGAPAPQSAHAPAQPLPTAGEIPVPGWLLHALPDLTGPDAPMTFAHLCAGVVLGLWLASGERALFTVLALTARRLLPRMCGQDTVSTPPSTTIQPAPVRCRPQRVLVHCIGRRGPPLTA